MDQSWANFSKSSPLAQSSLKRTIRELPQTADHFGAGLGVSSSYPTVEDIERHQACLPSLLCISCGFHGFEQYLWNRQRQTATFHRISLARASYAPKAVLLSPQSPPKPRPPCLAIPLIQRSNTCPTTQRLCGDRRKQGLLANQAAGSYATLRMTDASGMAILACTPAGRLRFRQ